MKRRCLLALAILLALASCTKIDFNTLVTGTPYVGLYQGKDCVVVLDQVDEGNLRGRAYSVDGSLYVAPIAFSSDLNAQANGSLWIDGRERKLKKVSLKDGCIQGRLDDDPFSLSLDEDTNLQFMPQYIDKCYDVAEERGRFYADDVEGYWMSYRDTHEDFATIYLKMVPKLSHTRHFKLDMDVYSPQDTALRRRPLLLLIHGGAFYNGDKQAVGYPEMGHYFAERGYVVASINYRLGFKPLAGDVDRAGYRAVQDAHAAVCYLIDHAQEYGIDTTMIFAAGTSAGAITALNLAFMQEDNRPETTRKGGVKGWMSTAGKSVLGIVDNGVRFVGNLFNRDWSLNLDEICMQLGLDTDLGSINAVAGSIDRPFQMKAVVNMWGAVHDLSMLANAPETSILSFHGDKDPIVPYAYGYPFDEVLEPYVDDIVNGLPDFMQGVAYMMRKWMSDGKPVNEWAFNPMQGSKAIHDKVSSMPGRKGRSELHTLEGADSHSLHVDDNGLNDYFYDTIIPTMTRFLCEEMVGGVKVELVRAEPDGQWFEAKGTNNVAELHWQVEGGAVVNRSENKVKVMLFADAPKHSVTVCGKYVNGVEFRETWKSEE